MSQAPRPTLHQPTRAQKARTAVQAARTAWIGVFCALWLVQAVLPARAAAGAASPIAFDVAAESALLVDADTGQVLFSKNPDEKLPPASIAKIMTMLLIMEALDADRITLEEKVPVSTNAYNMGGSQVYLDPKEQFSLSAMLEAVAVASANDASTALAEHLAGTEAVFIDAMNQRSKELGMANTYFGNPHGLPPSPGEPPTVTTARDIATMARELFKHPRIFTYTAIKEKVFREQPRFVLRNTNDLLWTYNGADGLKTGHTDEAGWSLVATAKRGDVRLLSVVLKTASLRARDEQSTRLLDYGFNRFAALPVAQAKEIIGTIKRRDAVPEQIPVQAATVAHVLVLRGQEASVTRTLEPLPNVSLPLKAGQPAGRLVVKSGDQEILSVTAVAGKDVHRANLLVRFFRTIRDFFAGLFRRG